MREAVAVLTVWLQLISRVRTRGVFTNEEEQRKPPGAGIHMFRQRLPTKWPGLNGNQRHGRFFFIPNSWSLCEDGRPLQMYIPSPYLAPALAATVVASCSD